MDIRGKKLVVIGGAGLIGSHTVDRLLLEDVREIVVYDNFVRGSIENLAAALKDPRVRIHEVGGDIMQTDILQAALDGTDGVFHLAALWLLQCHEYPRSAFDVNVRGTFNVMEACVNKGVQATRLFVIGIRIRRCGGRANDRGPSVQQQELLWRDQDCRRGDAARISPSLWAELVGLRYMNVYGPRQDYHGAYIAVIMKMLDAIDKGESPTIMGDGSEAFDFVAVEDCGLANVCAMKADAVDSFYNVGTGKRTSLKELAEMLLQSAEASEPINYAPRSQATLVRNRIGSPEKATAEIGFTASIDLSEGLKRLIDWRASHKAEVAARRTSAGLAA